MQSPVYLTLEDLEFERITFAHSLIADQYNYHISEDNIVKEDNFYVLEIGFVEENPGICTTPYGEIVYEENAIFVIPPHCDVDVSVQDASRIHRHTSAEFLIRCKPRFTSTFEMPHGKTVTLPLYIAPSPENSEIFALIREIACAKTAQLRRNYFEECADFMKLIHKMTERAQMCVDGIDTASPGNRRHCNRAKAYVSENIDKRLTVSDVANAIGVSKNYLTNVFSATEGVPLMEYINRSKLSYMMLLIRRYGYTLAQAGRHVGFSDVNYISRIFKRYYGMTVTEYKRSQEISE